MKSKYQDPVFAEYWNRRAGSEGESFKRYVLDPIMLHHAGDLRGKTILDLGCGNGYLAQKLLKQNPKKVVLMDISEYNISYAKEKTRDPRVEFVVADATVPWNIPSQSIDVVYSNMLLNEIENITTPIREAYRVLKPESLFLCSITHPAWYVYIVTQEKAGMASRKIQELKGYFHRGYAKYIMGSDSNTNPDLAREYNQEFEVEHYQRTISDYFSEFTKAEFTVRHLIEPELTEELISHSPRFTAMKDVPIGLIFIASKQ